MNSCLILAAGNGSRMKLRRRKRRRVPGINTASIADISFTLLILFLVVTSMDDEKGLSNAGRNIAFARDAVFLLHEAVAHGLVDDALHGFAKFLFQFIHDTLPDITHRGQALPSMA